MTEAIKLCNLHFRYKGQKDYLLKGVNLLVNKGELLALVGLSGCGKSSLCYIMCGIIPNIYGEDFSGEVMIWGKSAKNMRPYELAGKIGIIFSDPDTQLFSPTVEDELAFGPENLCIGREEIGRRIDRVLRDIGMEEYRYENPNNLSGGQKQLIALGAVLTLEPDIIIFDEALAQLDKEKREQIRRIMTELKKSGKTIIMVEHNLNSLDIADRVIILKDGIAENFTGDM